jgi:Cell wall-active antibiotics response 4TMS YvqF
VAKTRGELEPLTADLPAPTDSRGGEGTRWTVSIMGGTDRKGRWRIAARSTVVNFMGGSDLDLRDALIDSNETVITVVSIMGGSDIVVPEGVEVELGGFALMGGNDLEVEGPRPRPGAPVVRVRAFSLMGGTDVKTEPPRRTPPSSGDAPSLGRPG